MVAGVREPSGWTEPVERRCDHRNADVDGNIDVHGCGERQRVACTDGIAAGTNRRDRNGAEDYDVEPGGGNEWKLVQRHIERDGWIAELHVVDFVGQPAGGPEPVERRRDLGYADIDAKFDIRGCGDGQRITDGLCTGVDHGFGGCADDHVDEPGGGNEWQLLQLDTECDGWDSEFHVVDFVGQSAGGSEYVERRRDLGNADGIRYIDVHSCGEGQRITGADCIGPAVHHGKCSSEQADDYVDEPRCGADRKFVQHDAERDGRCAELHVVDFGQSAGGSEHVERRRDLGYADSNG
jgi:hypothetical protein